jgi:aconitate hydratase
LQGATNAFTGTAGHGKNVLSGQADWSVSEIARDYKSRGARWVAAGDFNYAERQPPNSIACWCILRSYQ